MPQQRAHSLTCRSAAGPLVGSQWIRSSWAATAMTTLAAVPDPAVVANCHRPPRRMSCLVPTSFARYIIARSITSLVSHWCWSKMVDKCTLGGARKAVTGSLAVGSLLTFAFATGSNCYKHILKTHNGINIRAFGQGKAFAWTSSYTVPSVAMVATLFCPAW